MTDAPHLLVGNGVRLAVVVLAVRLARAKLERTARLRSVLHALVQALKHGLARSLELGRPVQRTTARVVEHALYM